jgi:uncharacterized protein YfaS (alpha-2-macroglobulin family)
MGEATHVTVQADYFFGAPAAGLPVQWTIRRSYSSYPPTLSACTAGDVLEGEGTTDSNGRYVIELPAYRCEVARLQNVIVSAYVTAPGQPPLVASTAIDFHLAETLLRARPASYVNQALAPLELRLVATDWDEQPAPGRPLTVTFYQRQWMATTDPNGETNWRSVDIPLESGQATSDEWGLATVSFTPPVGGSYYVTATVTDAGGRSYSTNTSFWVAGADATWGPMAARTLSLVADQQEYRPGDTARVLVRSPFTEPVLAWLNVEYGVTAEQQVITFPGGSHLLEIPIKAEYAPEFYISLVAVQGTQGGTRFADIRLGSLNLDVSTEQLALTIQLTPQETHFLPGESVTYDILVTDYLSRPVAADLSLALVDLAVLTLKPDNTRPILEDLYDYRSFHSRYGGSLFVSAEGLPIRVPDLYGYGGGGGGDGGPGLSGLPAYGLPDDPRRNFPDTAYWNASIRTDASGRATVTIPLPDSLTTWRLSSKGVSLEGTLVGQASVDVVVNKPLLIRPITPRFFTTGDIIQLGGVVHNNSPVPLTVWTSLEASGVTLSGPAVQTATIPAGGNHLIQWPATVQDVDWVSLTFRAAGGGYRDATLPTFGTGPDQLIPVYGYNAEALAGTAGVLDQPGRVVEAILLPPAVDSSQGQLTLQLTPSLAAAIVQALADTTINTNGRDDCAHLYADQLLLAVAAHRLHDQLQLPEPAGLDAQINNSLRRLEEVAVADDGWGWCSRTRSDPSMTAHALLAVAHAQEIGYFMDLKVHVSAATELASHLRSPSGLYESADINEQAFWLYVLALNGHDMTSRLEAFMAEQEQHLDPYAAALLLSMFHQQQPDSPAIAALLDDLNEKAILSATGVHWEDAEPDYRHLSGDVWGTAAVISTLAQVDPDNPLGPPAVRWLMAAREATFWESPHETAWSVLALADWLDATQEGNADYDYQVQLNDTPVATGASSHFEVGAITTAQTLTVAVAALQTDDLNLLSLEHGPGPGRLYYTVYLDLFVPASQVQAASQGMTLQRLYYDADCDPEATTCQPITTITAGQQIRVVLTLVVPHDHFHVILEDPLPAGAEALDPNLALTSAVFNGSIERTDVDDRYEYGYWGWWYFDQISYRDEKVIFTSRFLPAGTYQYTYYLSATIPGLFQVMPAIAYAEFFPEVFGRSEGLQLTIQSE